MAPAVPVIAAVAGAAAKAALIKIGLTPLIAAAAGAILSAGIQMAGSRLFAKKPQAPSLPTDTGLQQELVRSSVEPHKVIYGQIRVGGTLVYAGSTNTANDTSDSGTNMFLHMVIAMAGHEVEEIGQIYVDDTPVQLDGNGYVITAPYQKTVTTPVLATATALSASISSTVMTVTTTLPHGFSAGEIATIVGQPSTLAGRYTILATPTSTTFTVVRPGYPNQVLTGVNATISVQRTSTAYSSYIKVKKHLGTPDQAADSDLVAQVPGWTANHRLRGIAYVYVRLQWNQDIFIHGIPTINAVLKGKKCYDPRTATTAWTANAALCVRDYLTSSYGFNVPAARINDAHFIAAANTADEDVPMVSGATQKRYTCNGVIDTQYIPLDNLQQLVSSLAGAVVYVQGKFRLHAAAYDAPEASFNIDSSPSILAGAAEIRTRPDRQDMFNAVRGVFVDPARDYQPTDFPPVTNATYEAEDGGTRIYRDIQLPFTNSAEAAQRIAKVILEKARQGITVTFPATYAALKLAPMSVVTLTDTATGWNNKVFRVMKFGFSMTQGVTVTLQEESSASYDWNSGEATTTDPAPDTDLPNALIVTPPGAPSVGEALYTTRNSAGVKTRATITWVASADAFIKEYQAEYRVADYGTWLVLPRTVQNTLTIEDATAGTYDFRVKAINSFGVSSDYVYALGITLLGLSAPPADIAGLNVSAGQDVALLNWQTSEDLDVLLGGNIVIRHTPDIVSPSWSAGLEVARFAGNAASGTAPLLDGTYMAKAVDSSGNWSENATLVKTNLASLIVMNEVATFHYGTDFDGAKVFMSVVDGKLQLASALDFSEMPGDMSTWPLVSAIGGYQVDGTYIPRLGGLIDLGDVYPCRVTATLDAVAFDFSDRVSARTNNISEWPSFVGGVVNDITAQVFIRATNDDPLNPSAEWTEDAAFVSGNFTARAFQHYLYVTHNGFQGADSPTTNLAVTDVTITVDMPDRVESASGVPVPAAGATITFASAFKAVPHVGVTALDMATGDYWVITNQTETSFDIRFFNAAGTGIARTMNWAAHGHGKQGG